MTDRINSLTVVLEKDIRDDDIKPLINALKMMRGVIAVECNVSDYVVYMAEERAKHNLGQELLNIVYPKKD